MGKTVRKFSKKAKKSQYKRKTKGRKPIRRKSTRRIRGGKAEVTIKTMQGHLDDAIEIVKDKGINEWAGPQGDPEGIFTTLNNLLTSKSGVLKEGSCGEDQTCRSNKGEIYNKAYFIVDDYTWSMREEKKRLLEELKQKVVKFTGAEPNKMKANLKTIIGFEHEKNQTEQAKQNEGYKPKTVFHYNIPTRTGRIGLQPFSDGAYLSKILNDHLSTDVFVSTRSTSNVDSCTSDQGGGQSSYWIAQHKPTEKLIYACRPIYKEEGKGNFKNIIRVYVLKGGTLSSTKTYLTYEGWENLE